MDLAHSIDHTLLKPALLANDIKQVCIEAVQFEFAAVCIPPFYVHEAALQLEHSDVKVSTVVGFPMGYTPVSAKVEEIKKAINDGSDELDIVINLCAVKNGNWNVLRNEVDSLATACHMKGKIMKLIIETGLLTIDEIKRVCELSVVAEADYVKTSTGFNGPGASVEVVQFLRNELPDKIKIKASGGIRDRAFALQLLAAGASRIGTSSGVALIQN